MSDDHDDRDLAEDLDQAALHHLAERARAGEFTGAEGEERLVVHLMAAEELGPDHEKGAGEQDVAWLVQGLIEKRYRHTREHRLPQGPNEDIAICQCGRPTFSLRPEGETYGHHLPDCRLDARHLSFCQPGGAGHPPAPVIRGYWPQQYLVRYEINDSSQPAPTPLVSGTFTIAAETPQRAEELALIKAKADYANDMLDEATIHIGGARLAREDG